MPGIRVSHSIGDLASDMRKIADGAPRALRGVVREGIKVGNTVARDNAKRTAGQHGKLYHRAFSAEMRPTFAGFGSATYSGEYGPDIAKPQGGMSFEWGSRNQPPHQDLAKSADLIGTVFAHEVGRTVDGWFW
jgi:hypothetical protein